MMPGQIAGLVHFSATHHLLGVRCDDAGQRHLVYVSANDLRTGPVMTAEQLFLHSCIRGEVAWFLWADELGETPQCFGPGFQLQYGNGLGNRIGLACWNDVSESGLVDFQDFRYRHDGPPSLIR